MIIKKSKIFFISLMFLFFIYLFFKSYHIFANDNITYNYKNNSFVRDDKIVFKGVGKHLKDLEINGEKVYMNLDGEFSKDIYLYNGKNDILLKYTNNFNKNFVKDISIYKQ